MYASKGPWSNSPTLNPRFRACPNTSRCHREAYAKTLTGGCRIAILHLGFVHWPTLSLLETFHHTAGARLPMSCFSHNAETPKTNRFCLNFVKITKLRHLRSRIQCLQNFNWPRRLATASEASSACTNQLIITLDHSCQMIRLASLRSNIDSFVRIPIDLHPSRRCYLCEEGI